MASRGCRSISGLSSLGGPLHFRSVQRAQDVQQATSPSHLQRKKRNASESSFGSLLWSLKGFGSHGRLRVHKISCGTAGAQRLELQLGPLSASPWWASGGSTGGLQSGKAFEWEQYQQGALQPSLSSYLSIETLNGINFIQFHILEQNLIS